jgi:SAM-dependent methyltransferase
MLKLHHNIPGLRRVYLQRDDARKKRDETIIDLNEALNQRAEAIRKFDEAIIQLEEARRFNEVKANPWLEFSSMQLAHSISEPEFVSHTKSMPYLSRNFNKEGMRILEVGSRNVTGTNLRSVFSSAYYVGFDFYEGENVDVVGDAHKLSSYFRDDEKFDLIFSSAVFEHFHMPWIVAQEIQKMLKVGGYVYTETHFSYSAHERPWNFFQFSDMGLRVLFNSALGFEVVDCGMSNRMNGVFSQEADEYLRGKAIVELYCHSEILAKKVRDVLEFNWASADIDEIVATTRYPPPKNSAPAR